MEFREIRKKKNEIRSEAITQLLLHARRGVLAVNGDDGYPYAIPVNYWYDAENRKIYFHGARVGYKVDALNACDKVCFTVYGNEQVKGDSWAPYVQSAVIFGRCHLIKEPTAAIELVRRFAGKYYPSEQLVESAILSSGNAVQMFEITIEHISGKEVQEK